MKAIDDNQVPTVLDKESQAKSHDLWGVISQWIKEAGNKTQYLSRNADEAEKIVKLFDINTSDTLGAIVFHSGGLLIDDGWIRILGSGNKLLQRNLYSWNKGLTFIDYPSQAGYILVGDDAMGGLFAMNKGYLSTDEKALNKIFYFVPDMLEWLYLDLNYSEFLLFAMNADLNEFYQDLRFHGWEKTIKDLHGDDALQCKPFLWTEEGKDVESTKKQSVSMLDQYNFLLDNKEIMDKLQQKK